jgi:cytochrome c553
MQLKTGMNRIRQSKDRVACHRRKLSRYALGGMALALALTLVVSGCSSSTDKGSQTESSGQSASSGTSVAITPDARAKAKDIFSSRCAVCHGPTGQGNGPGASGLTPKPSNFHDKSWQTSATDQAIEQAILYGGAAVGKSPMMPANPDLQSQPAVVSALRETIRQLGNEK